MIEKLTKVEGSAFRECYEGYNGDKRVVCILDNNCVRYTGFKACKRTTCRKYTNAQKDICMARALAWLNK